jgi:transcriptional regulator with XRE-family HTH domain
MPTKTFGNRIRELRKEKELSLREFGKALGGVSAAFLSDIELGRRYPSDEVLEQMARVLDIDIEELRSHDSRPPLEDIRRLAESNPAYGAAFRKVIDSKVSPEELIQLAEERPRRRKKGIKRSST